MEEAGFGTSDGEPPEYSRSILGIDLPRSSYSDHVPTVFLRFPIWGHRFSPFIHRVDGRESRPGNFPERRACQDRPQLPCKRLQMS